MWSYDSSKHLDLTVRSVVERTIREGLGLGEKDLRNDLTASAIVRVPSEELTPIAIPEPDLRASSVGLTMADSQSSQILSDSDGCGGFEGDLASDPVALGVAEVGSLSSVALGDDDSEPARSDFALTENPREFSGLEGEERASPATEEGAVAMKQPHLSLLADALVLVCEGDGVAAGPFCRGSIVAAVAVQGRPGSEVLIDDDVASQRSGNCRLGGLIPVIEQEVDGGFGGAAMLIPKGDGGQQMGEDGAGSDAMMKTKDNVFSSMNSLLISTVDTIADGFVREEVWVSLTTREALRPQPTDGLWQSPSSSVEPVLERLEKEKGIHGDAPAAQEVHRGVQAGRSFAHAVHADRRADVELSFIPPVDGGNNISMEESDEDAERWGSCLVGYFLQGSLPFGYVRSTVSRLWTKLGLTGVQSLDDGFFVFRFADSFNRDGVLEGGPCFVGGKPILLRKWECLLSLSKETLSRIPVWASFFNILLEYWTAAGLSRIVSVVGRPLHLDRYTASRERLAYARVCICNIMYI
ncbi:hypothetical protein Dimus_039162 [Dionaea muscipula]